MPRKDTKRGRFYQFRGKGPFPSVTTLLSVIAKPALIGWAAKLERLLVTQEAAELYSELSSMLAEPVSKEFFKTKLEERLGAAKAHQRVMREAADIGTAVHKRIEWEFKKELGRLKDDDAGPPLLVHPKAQESFRKWQDWRAQVKLRVIDIELEIGSVLFGFGGTLDLLAETTDDAGARRTIVGDFKTGKGIYLESFLQNALYRIALREMGVDTDGGVIIRLPKEAEDPDFEVGEVPALDQLMVPALAVIPIWKLVKDHEDRREAARRKAPEKAA